MKRALNVLKKAVKWYFNLAAQSYAWTQMCIRDRKHPIVKDKSGHTWYNRIIRRRQRQQVKEILTLQDALRML